MLVSIIIPTLDEAGSIGALLGALTRLPGAPEVTVVDGGSRDDTCAIARACGARVITSARGRGAQLHAGACAARGDAFWFLHADTLPPVDAIAQITSALAQDTQTVGGNFTIRFDGDERAARFLTWLYPRLRRLGLAYGDSGFFVRRAVYEQCGGFQSFPIFEDLDLLRRLWRHGRFVQLDAQVVTSARRFAGCSFILTFTRWSILQGLYWLGVHPRHLGRLYAPIRGRRVDREQASVCASVGASKDESDETGKTERARA
ncbi:MAG: TIGR04283 family arsenosugar biosynthesis glycosyltransferase [Pyrinomonadaceae bacterium]